MHRYLALTALLTTHSCNALRQSPRMQALLKTQSSTALRRPPRLPALRRRAAAAPALAFLAAVATPAATALPPPEGCVSDAARNHTISTQSTSAKASIHAGLDRRRRIPRPQVGPGRQAHQRELGLQRELCEGVWCFGIHRDASHPRLSGSPSKSKEMICTFSGSAAARAASAPSTAAARRTNYDDEKSL